MFGVLMDHVSCFMLSVYISILKDVWYCRKKM